MPTKPVDPHMTKALPSEYAGKWVAWTSDHSRIVAHSQSVRELWQIVHDLGIDDPVFEKILRVDVRFVGMR